MHTEIIVSGAHLPDLQGKGQLRQDGQGGEQPLLQVDHHQIWWRRHYRLFIASIPQGSEEDVHALWKTFVR